MIDAGRPPAPRPRRRQRHEGVASATAAEHLEPGHRAHGCEHRVDEQAVGAEAEDHRGVAEVLDLHRAGRLRRGWRRPQRAGAEGRYPFLHDHRRAVGSLPHLRGVVRGWAASPPRPRRSGVSQSTVSRHLARLEADAGSPLLLRETTPVPLTARGEALLAAIQPMVDAALGAQAALEHARAARPRHPDHGRRGRALGAEPALRAFYRAYPHLRLRILADNQVHSLAAGEADIALRLARPARGEVYARKLRVETYGLFAAPRCWRACPGPRSCRGSGSPARSRRSPSSATPSGPSRRARRACWSRTSRRSGTPSQAGMGVGVLPRGFAARLSGVDEVRAAQVGARELGPIPSRASVAGRAPPQARDRRGPRGDRLARGDPREGVTPPKRREADSPEPAPPRHRARRRSAGSAVN